MTLYDMTVGSKPRVEAELQEEHERLLDIIPAALAPVNIDDEVLAGFHEELRWPMDGNDWEVINALIGRDLLADVKKSVGGIKDALESVAAPGLAAKLPEQLMEAAKEEYKLVKRELRLEESDVDPATPDAQSL